MTEKTSRKDIWEAAGYAGLALGLASTIYMYIVNTLASSEISTGIATLGNLILWMAKFVGCIFLMKFFMKKFHADLMQPEPEPASDVTDGHVSVPAEYHLSLIHI